MLRFGILLLAGVLCFSTVFGCSWAGRTTGKVVNKVEKGADDFQDSYEEERKNE